MIRIIGILLSIFITITILSNFLSNSNSKSDKINPNKKEIRVIKKDKNKTKLKRVKKPTIKSKVKIVDDFVGEWATWYRTEGSRVHRDYPTAAYNKYPKGTKLLVTNLDNGDTCVVEITDRCKSLNKIDLSHSAFGKISKHSIGKVKVFIKKI